jgi:RNA polymerase-binding transcription factor DksA
MATKKKAAKPAAKKPAKPAKKTTPAKKAAPQKKVALKKATVKKPVAKSAKPAPKPVAKKPAKSAKPVAKKVIPAKKAVSKPAIKKPVIPAKPIKNSMTKKIPEKKPVQQSKAATSKVVAGKTSQAPVKLKDNKVAVAKPVVLPAINTKTSRKYQPDFTKSVLDQPINDPGAPTVRYSDSDLKEFRELIQRKLDSAKKELAYLQGLITRKDEMGGDEGDNRYMTMEDGSLSMEREQLSQMASRQITFIDHLEKALMRIENKTYGVCRVTGRLIDKARLRAVPHATLSIEAKMSTGK